VGMGGPTQIISLFLFYTRHRFLQPL